MKDERDPPSTTDRLRDKTPEVLNDEYPIIRMEEASPFMNPYSPSINDNLPRNESPVFKSGDNETDSVIIKNQPVFDEDYFTEGILIRKTRTAKILRNLKKAKLNQDSTDQEQNEFPVLELDTLEKEMPRKKKYSI